MYFNRKKLILNGISKMQEGVENKANDEYVENSKGK